MLTNRSRPSTYSDIDHVWPAPCVPGADRALCCHRSGCGFTRSPFLRVLIRLSLPVRHFTVRWNARRFSACRALPRLPFRPITTCRTPERGRRFVQALLAVPAVRRHSSRFPPGPGDDPLHGPGRLLSTDPEVRLVEMVVRCRRRNVAALRAHRDAAVDGGRALRRVRRGRAQAAWGSWS